MRARLRNDILLIASIALAAALIFAAGAIFRQVEKGETVEVTLGGEHYASLPLSQNAELDIEGLCLLKIENGEAYVAEAVCRNQICVRHRPISAPGEVIICLPGRVAVRISGGPDFVV